MNRRRIWWSLGRWSVWLLLLSGNGPWIPVVVAAQVGDTARAEGAVPRGTIDLKVLIDADLRVESRGSEATGPTFGLRRVRLITQGTLGEHIAYRVLLEPSGLALGPEGAAPFRGVPLVEAVLDYRLSNALILHVGQQRLPFGLAASTVAPSLPTPEFPLATRILIQRVSVFRDIGLSVSGRVHAVEYSAGLFNGAGINVGSDNNDARDVVGRVVYVPTPGWSIGGSGWSGRSGELYAPEGEPQPTFYDDAAFGRWGLETRFARGPVQIWLEYLTDRTEVNTDAINPIPSEKGLRRRGWNLLAAYRVRDDLEMVGRYDRWQPLGVGGSRTSEYVAGVQWYLEEVCAPEDPRLGAPLNAARRHSRIMVFLEHQSIAASPSSTILRFRWELFY